MLKQPKKAGSSWVVSGIKIAVVLELAFVGASYLVWSKMNKSRDFRFKMHNSFPVLLKGYYMTGETLGGFQTKQEDYKAWGIEDTS